MLATPDRNFEPSGARKKSNPASLCQRVRNFGRAYPLRVFARGLPIEAPLQLVSSNEFWLVVLTPFDQWGSESEPPSDGSTSARYTIMANVSNVHLFPREIFKLKILFRLPRRKMWEQNGPTSTWGGIRTVRRKARMICEKSEPSVPPISQKCIWAPTAKSCIF